MEPKLDKEIVFMLKRKKRKKIWARVLSVMMCLVVFCTTYILILPAITMETDTFCGIEAHTHTDECFEQTLICQTHEHSDDCYLEQSQLICILPESEGHTHTDACTQTEQILSCGQTESEGHIHTDACVQTEQILSCGEEESQDHIHSDDCYTTSVTYVCGQEEFQGHTHTDSCYTTTVVNSCGQEEVQPHTHSDECYKVTQVQVCPLETASDHEHTESCYDKQVICQLEEHEHSLSCYADPSADLETAAVWEATLPNQLSGEYAADVLAIAKSQVGYTESTRNYIVSESGEIKGYTRYGDWYGIPYDDWCAMFVSFCLNYAGVEEIPLNSSCPSWINALKEKDMYESAAGYTPRAGDIIFFDQNNDGSSDHMGIVAEHISATDYTAEQIKTIEGNSDNAVRYVTYNLANSTIMGYGIVAVRQETEDQSTTETTSSVATRVATKTAVIYTDDTYTTVSGDASVITLTGVIPGDAEIRAYPVVLENNRILCAYDIAIFLPDGTVFEPDPDQSITVSIQSDSIQEENLEVYYHPDEGEPERVDSTATEDGVSFDTNHFSTYAVYALDDPYDLSNYIKNVSVSRKDQDDTTWTPVEDGTVYVGDSLRFTLEYLIGANVLDDNNYTLTYDLPVEMTKTDSGYVYDENNNIVGSYTISEYGVITIIFTKDYATSNSEGAEISGHISFESTVENLDTDVSGSIDLPFNETLHLQVEGIENVTNDLRVTKQASNANITGGTVDYTIVVTSENGTGSAVLLNDVLTGIQVNGDITVKDKNGNNVSVTITKTNNGFNMELPPLGAGESYTITYSAKIPNAENLNGTVDANNKVNVESTDHNGGKLVDEDEVDTTFERNVLEKSGKLDGDTITWTVVVNTSKLNISNWKLSDIMGGTPYTDAVTISPDPVTGSGSTTVPLPYTFPAGSNKTYTVTYQTTVESGNIGNTNYNNTAVLEPGDGGRITEGDSVTTTDYNPLSKEGEGVIVSGQLADGSMVAEYKWDVTIDASESNIEPYTQNINGQSYTVWYYGDEIWNEQTHWMTGAQVKAMAENLRANYSGQYTILAYVWNNGGAKYQSPIPLDQVSDTAKYSQFRILFYDTLSQGSKIQFQYSTTANIGDGTANKSVTNYGTVNGKVSDQASQTYHPIVTKVDKKGRGDTTEHLISDLILKGYTGVLGWDVDVYIPNAEFTNNLIIIEDIPDGTQLLDRASGEWSLSFNLQDFSNENFNFNGETTASITKNGYTVTAKYTDGAYVITVPAALANAHAGKTIRIEVRVQINEDFDWGDAYKSFVNKVIVTSGGTQLGETTQTQIVHNPILVKASGTVSNNIIPYSLDINPESRNLLAHADTMTLTDVLEYLDPTTGAINASLMTDSVKIYKINSDGSQEDITLQCPFTFNEATSDGTSRKIITMTLPDDVHLLVQYSYRVTGTIGVQVTLGNTATIEGMGSSLDNDDHGIIVTVEQSNAGATLVGVKIVKVDAENYSVHLEGAKYNLEEWDGEKFTLYKSFATNDQGTFSTGELKADTAYQLVEVDSPHGYEIDPTPYQFYIVGTGTSLNAPEDFVGKALNNGDSVFLTNEKQAYELPETGGAGTYPYTAVGLLLILTSTAYLMYISKKRRKETY